MATHTSLALIGLIALLAVTDGVGGYGTPVLRHSPSLLSVAPRQAYFDLHEAARVGDSDKVRRLLREGASPNEQDDPFGWTPLHYACAFNSDRPELVELLLDHGADADARTADGTTPLHLAATECATDVIHMLLRAGANPNAASHSGSTPLMRLLSMQKSDAIRAARLLLDAGATTARGERPIGPLQLAAMHYDARMLNLLVQHGADIRETDPEGNTLLAVAARAGNRGAVEYCVEKFDVDCTNKYQQTPLILSMCAQYIDEKLVTMLLDHGADPAASDHEGVTALHRASRRGALGAVRAILRAGGDAEVPDHAGRSAIDWAKEAIAKLSSEPITIPEVTEDLDDSISLKVNAIRRGKALQHHEKLQDLLAVLVELRGE